MSNLSLSEQQSNGSKLVSKVCLCRMVPLSTLYVYLTYLPACSLPRTDSSSRRKWQPRRIHRDSLCLNSTTSQAGLFSQSSQRPALRLACNLWCSSKGKGKAGPTRRQTPLQRTRAAFLWILESMTEVWKGMRLLQEGRWSPVKLPKCWPLIQVQTSACSSFLLSRENNRRGIELTSRHLQLPETHKEVDHVGFRDWSTPRQGQVWSRLHGAHQDRAKVHLRLEVSLQIRACRVQRREAAPARNRDPVQPQVPQLCLLLCVLI